MNELVTGVKIDDFPPNARVKRTDDKFKIHLEYLPSFTRDPDAELLKKQFMEPALDVIRSAIKPKVPLEGILRIDRQCVSQMTIKYSDGKVACAYGCEEVQTCNNEPIPEKYLKKCKTKDINNTYIEEGREGEGVMNTDLVILVIRKPCDPDMRAWAVNCALEETLDRPIFGILNFCSTKMKANQNIERGVNTIVHELIHILGFGSNRFAYFRDRDGNPLVPRDAFNKPNLGVIDGVYKFNDKIAKKVTRHRYSKQLSYTKSVYALTLPTVVKEAQEFFDCHSLTEVDLEDTGPEGALMSHFDEYVLHDEIMSPQQFKVENLTRLTLAFLYDTGWYNVDYCAAKPMEYGYKAGCTLPLEGCYKYMKEQRKKRQSIAPFCDKYDSKPRHFSCSSDFKNINICHLKKLKNPKYDYLESHMGGDQSMMEYCPVYHSLSCETKEIDIPMANPNVYGIDSRCSANNAKLGPFQYGGVSCLKTTCESDKYTLQTTYGTVTCVNSKDVTINSVTFKCIPQTTMCPTSDGTTCGITNETKIQIIYENPKNEIRPTDSASNNIQISQFYVLFNFMVLICLLP